MQWRVGPFRVDLDNDCLWRGDECLVLRPKTFAVLAYLVEHAGELVTRDDLLAAVWPQTIVADSALAVSISELRKVFGETAKAPLFIATVHRRGYRFTAPVVAGGSSVSPSETEIDQEPMVGSLAEHGDEVTVRSPRYLVSREMELTHLHTCFAQANQGQRHVVFISGEAGIGKTTLVDAFVDRIAPTATVWIAHGQCIEQYGAGEPYLPLLEAIGQLCRGPDGAHIMAQLARLAPSWLIQMPALLSTEAYEELQRRVAGATFHRI
ncbi:winged helix-turn-helix domain-containing protein [Candidatus Entotheonella palauensis]|uniref:winged helix-turn-helix domain-containing protein n=1 Tax=Candidatus Entotheonella palauensis TaxID=93172 RepID=UPI000B7FBEE0|nr:transcriptional regulator [Candidatus Entotheonella palauensis]